MPEMTEIHCITSEVTRRAANIQRLIDKLRAMPEASLDNFDSALLSVNLEIAADALKTVEEMAAYLSRPIVETSRLWKNGSGLGSLVTCRHPLLASRRRTKAGLHTPVPGVSSRAVTSPDNTAHIFRRVFKGNPRRSRFLTE